MKKLIAKLKHQKSIINFNTHEVITDYGIYQFDDIDFDYSEYNTFQIIYLKKNRRIVSSLFFDNDDTFKIQYKLQVEFSKCNRKLEFLLANYKKLKGGE